MIVSGDQLALFITAVAHIGRLYVLLHFDTVHTVNTTVSHLYTYVCISHHVFDCADVFSCTYRLLQCATLLIISVRSCAGVKDFASGKQVSVHFVIVEFKIFQYFQCTNSLQHTHFYTVLFLGLHKLAE